jgi:hypothetical protein
VEKEDQIVGFSGERDNVVSFADFSDRIAKRSLSERPILDQIRDIRAARGYLSMRLSNVSPVGEDIVAAIITDLESKLTHRDDAFQRLQPLEKERHMLKERMRDIFWSPTYHLIDPEDDPLKPLFINAFKEVVSDSSEDQARKTKALQVLYRMHIVSLINPAINNKPHPRLEAAIAAIMGDNDTPA